MLAMSDTFQRACIDDTQENSVSCVMVAAGGGGMGLGKIQDVTQSPLRTFQFFPSTSEGQSRAIELVYVGAKIYITNGTARWPSSTTLATVTAYSPNIVTVSSGPAFSSVFAAGQTLTVHNPYVEALEHVHYEEADDTEAAVYPRAIVLHEPGHAIRRVDNSQHAESGTVAVSFEVQSSESTLDDKATECLNIIGSTVAECFDKGGIETEPGETRTFLNVTSIECVAGPERCVSNNENGTEFWGAVYNFHYGDSE